MSNQTRVGVLFVCLGNICRSPSSEGVFRQCVEESGIELDITIDSAGTADYHRGQPPDSRAIAAADKRGIDLSKLRARRVNRSDFEQYDYIIAMDRHNYDDLLYLAPADYSGVIRLFLDYTDNWREREIPDPYYGGRDGFEIVLDMIHDASLGLLNDIKNTYIKD